MKSKSLLYFIICLSVGGYLVSCTMSSGSLPYSQGNSGDVLIVMSDDLWRGASGDSVRSYFTEPVMGLPAPEPMFSLSQSSALSTLTKKYRNIIIINIDMGYETAKMGYKTDMYAMNQSIFNIDAPSADSAIVYLSQNKDRITAQFLMKSRDATIEEYKRSMNKMIAEKMREKNQVDIVIPVSYSLDVEKEDFVWISRIEGDREWGILMWKYPYLRTSQFDTDSLIFKMNAMTRRNVPGSVAGSYMADEPLVPPVVKRFEKDGVYSVQMNGLWQMENGYLGGPYVSQTIVDLKRGQLVTGYGFVCYPNRDKRQMIRQLEAILQTMMPMEEI